MAMVASMSSVDCVSAWVSVGAASEKAKATRSFFMRPILSRRRRRDSRLLALGRAHDLSLLRSLVVRALRRGHPEEIGAVGHLLAGLVASVPLPLVVTGRHRLLEALPDERATHGE